VMQTAFKMAVSGKTPAMTMFWLKTQAGWKEHQLEPEIERDIQVRFITIGPDTTTRPDTV
jgi:hypothetical protein